MCGSQISTKNIEAVFYINTSVDVHTKPTLGVFILKYDLERGADTQSQPEHLELSVYIGEAEAELRRRNSILGSQTGVI